MKKGISLIVLVITIIVMIILAASVVITLSNTGIINKANSAVNLTNEAGVQDMAALIWADAYMDKKRGEELANEVTTKLGEQGVTADKWNIIVTDTGVIIKSKQASGLGSLITSENYGDKVDYTTTVEVEMYDAEMDDYVTKTVTLDDWQIYYHNNEYVYLIVADNIEASPISTNLDVKDLTQDELSLYEKFLVGNSEKYTLVDIIDEVYVAISSKVVATFIRNYANYANKAVYGDNVVGAIGSPTIELLAAGWNAKGYAPSISLSIDKNGYLVNGENNLANITSDGFYFPEPGCSGYRLVSPAAESLANNLVVGWYGVDSYDYGQPINIRPVVCLKASIPATVGTGEYDFNLVK